MAERLTSHVHYAPVLKRSDRDVLLVLAGHAGWADGETASCYPSKDLIAVEASCSIATVKRCLKSLEELGVIRVDRAGGRHANTYHLNVVWLRTVARRFEDIKADCQRRKISLVATIKPWAALVEQSLYANGVPEDLMPLEWCGRSLAPIKPSIGSLDAAGRPQQVHGEPVQQDHHEPVGDVENSGNGVMVTPQQGQIEPQRVQNRPQRVHPDDPLTENTRIKNARASEREATATPPASPDGQAAPPDRRSKGRRGGDPLDALLDWVTSGDGDPPITESADEVLLGKAALEAVHALTQPPPVPFRRGPGVLRREILRTESRKMSPDERAACHRRALRLCAAAGIDPPDALTLHQNAA